MHTPPVAEIDREFVEKARTMFPLVLYEVSSGNNDIGANVMVLETFAINYSKNTVGSIYALFASYSASLGYTAGRPCNFMYGWEIVPTGDNTSGYNVSAYRSECLSNPIIIPARSRILCSNCGGSNSYIGVRIIPERIATDLGYKSGWRYW